MSPYRGMLSAVKAISVGRVRQGLVVPLGFIIGLLIFGFIDLLTTGQALGVAIVLSVLIGGAALLYRISGAAASSTVSSPSR